MRHGVMHGWLGDSRSVPREMLPTDTGWWLWNVNGFGFEGLEVAGL